MKLNNIYISRSVRKIAFFTLAFTVFFNIQCIPDTQKVKVFLTQPNKTARLELQKEQDKNKENPDFTIDINSHETYQKIDGFGFALTGGSAEHIHLMSNTTRQNLLEELFGNSPSSISLSYIRVSIGASDLDSEPFSYNDTVIDSADFDQTFFSIEPDRSHLIPVLKEILAINPKLKIMASPWSPPSWMKTNNSTIGGSLLPHFYDSYAIYLMKYIQEMAAEGIYIESITIQNEPLHPGNNPSMLMLEKEQANFIKQSLGPIFKANNINTKIIIYDHNADKTEYPIAVLNDPEANQYIDGSAFHLYGGKIEDLSILHNTFPDKNIYFTEQWYSSEGDFATDVKWHFKEVVIGGTRNWCKGIIEWNLSSNSDLEPHTDGGCTKCLGALTIDGDEVIRNAGYYAIGHASKFIKPGSYRISSNYFGDLPNSAFITPENDIILLISNNTDTVKSFKVSQNKFSFTSKLEAGDVATYIWKSN